MDEHAYLVDFEWRGRRLPCRIDAGSWRKAEERRAAVVDTGRISGRLVMEGEADARMPAQAGRC